MGAGKVDNERTAPPELRIPVLTLAGPSPDSLGHYLASLGLLRVLDRSNVAEHAHRVA